MSKTVLFMLALLGATSQLSAQQSPPPEREGFFQVLSECLSIPKVTVHECAVEYLAIGTPDGEGDPTAGGTIIKGKYNTCRIYGGTEFHIGGKGYSCWTNGTGKCVSGDCCDYMDSSC